MSSDQIARAAMRLSVTKRAQLAERLLDSLVLPTSDAIDSAWVAEAEKRIDQFDSGKSRAIPADKVFRRLKSRRSRKREDAR
jgi:putative addiction module component (TIGR02574 family)